MCLLLPWHSWKLVSCPASCFHSGADAVLTQLCIRSFYPFTLPPSLFSILLILNLSDCIGVPTKTCDKCVGSGVFPHLESVDRLCHPRPPLSPPATLHHMLTALSSCLITKVSTRVDRRSRTCEKQTNPSIFCSLRGIQERNQ